MSGPRSTELDRPFTWKLDLDLELPIEDNAK
jgi:hypothetical protein